MKLTEAHFSQVPPNVMKNKATTRINDVHPPTTTIIPFVANAPMYGVATADLAVQDN